MYCIIMMQIGMWVDEELHGIPHSYVSSKGRGQIAIHVWHHHHINATICIWHINNVNMSCGICVMLSSEYHHSLLQYLQWYYCSCSKYQLSSSFCFQICTGMQKYDVCAWISLPKPPDLMSHPSVNKGRITANYYSIPSSCDSKALLSAIHIQHMDMHVFRLRQEKCFRYYLDAFILLVSSTLIELCLILTWYLWRFF